LNNLYHFLAIIVLISGLAGRGQLFWIHTLLNEISTRESIPPIRLGQVYMCDSNNSVLKHNLRVLREAIVYTASRNLKQQMIQNSFDCMISRSRRCIRAGRHAFTDECRRLYMFLNHKSERTDNKVSCVLTQFIACCMY
jgi:hypothetical protein